MNTVENLHGITLFNDDGTPMINAVGPSVGATVELMDQAMRRLALASNTDDLMVELARKVQAEGSGFRSPIKDGDDE